MFLFPYDSSLFVDIYIAIQDGQKLGKKNTDVSKNTLHKRITVDLKLLSEDHLHRIILGPKKTVLTKDQEDKPIKYIIDMYTVFYGLTINDIQRIVF